MTPTWTPPSTLAKLLALWHERDDRYGKRRQYLDTETIVAVRAWRIGEMAGLSETDWTLAMYELRRTW